MSDKNLTVDDISSLSEGDVLWLTDTEMIAAYIGFISGTTIDIVCERSADKYGDFIRRTIDVTLCQRHNPVKPQRRSINREANQTKCQCTCQRCCCTR